MQICIASGKGGTGKTTVAVNLAWTIAKNMHERVHLVDCDVEAPNDHLFLQPKSVVSQDVVLPKPLIDKNICKQCGECAKVCRYNAISILNSTPLLFEEMCHACGACQYICPAQAISTKEVAIGKMHSATVADKLDLSWGELGIGQVQAPDMIKELRKKLDKTAINILDASPGCGCAVRETLANTDVTILVTEPTPFGLNDLRLAAQLSIQMNIPIGIVINRAVPNNQIIEDFAQEYNIPIIAKIPFDMAYAKNYSEGKILADVFTGFAYKMQELYANIIELPKSQQSLSSVIKPIKQNLSSLSLTSSPDSNSTDELVVISGKGGTGKTTLTAALAALRPNSTFFDADVDAANLNILLHGKLQETAAFSAGVKATIDETKCINCKKCITHCRFGAIEQTENHTVRVAAESCEGCGLCSLVCPEKAIDMLPGKTGFIHCSDTDNGKLAHAFLNIGEENSGKLVSHVRLFAKNLAHDYDSEKIVGDGPPGIGCPVIASITGSKTALIVTEPTVSGSHDLKRALKLTNHFGIKPIVVINKYDINIEQTNEIKDFCLQENIAILGEIPFDENVNLATVSCLNLMASNSSPAQQAIVKISDKLEKEFNL